MVLPLIAAAVVSATSVGIYYASRYMNRQQFLTSLNACRLRLSEGQEEQLYNDPPSLFEIRLVRDLFIRTQYVVRWDDIGGYGSLCETLRRDIVAPLTAGEAPQTNGVLIRGGVQDGKSLVINAAATAYNGNVVRLDAGRVMTEPDPESIVNAIFQLANKRLKPLICWPDQTRRVADLLLRKPTEEEGDAARSQAVTHLKDRIRSLWPKRGDRFVIFAETALQDEELDMALVSVLFSQFSLPELTRAEHADILRKMTIRRCNVWHDVDYTVVVQRMRPEYTPRLIARVVTEAEHTRARSRRQQVHARDIDTAICYINLEFRHPDDRDCDSCEETKALFRRQRR